ncbi:MAG TPA: alpha/beta family hydrolase [Chryseosolibacter sp.]
MKIESFKILVSETIGSVSGETVLPENISALLVLAHGAGADMNHKFMKSLAKGLADVGIGTLRFNFPFMENKKGRPDPPAVAEKTIEAVILKAKEMFPTTRLLAGGKSFGGRMTSNLLAKKQLPVESLIFYGFPLHAPGKASTERAAHLRDVKVPMLFLQGSKDTLAKLELITDVTSNLSLATLVVFEGADHSFAVGKKDVLPELINHSHQWISKTAAK